MESLKFVKGFSRIRKVRAFLSAVGGKYMGIPIVKPKSQKLP